MAHFGSFKDSKHLARRDEQLHDALIEGLNDILPSKAASLPETRHRGATGMRQLGIQHRRVQAEALEPRRFEPFFLTGSRKILRR